MINSGDTIRNRGVDNKIVTTRSQLSIVKDVSGKVPLIGGAPVTTGAASL